MSAKTCLKNLILGLTICSLLSNCLYSTHHFNSGETLKAGDSQLTMGFGRQPLWNCSETENFDTDKKLCNDSASNSSDPINISYAPKASINYRLGLKNGLGPFTNLEAIWHMEAPTNPVSMEFGLKLGLPTWRSTSWFHNMVAGWGIGIWADNSFYFEYAVSKSFWKQKVFGNLRGTWLATQVKDVFNQNLDQKLIQNKQYVFQSSLGFKLNLFEIPILPQYFIPQINFTTPQVTTGDIYYLDQDINDLLFDFNLGFGWTF